MNTGRNLPASAVERFKKVLVTGATGFIGSHLTRRLVRSRCYDVGIIKRRSSDVWRISDLLNKLTVFKTDLSDTESVSNAVMSFKPDVVFHLAAYYTNEHKVSDIAPLYNTNVLGTVNLLDASINSGAQLFINTSTCFVYNTRFEEMSKGIIQPVNLYAVTKLQGERACVYYSERGMKCVTLRLFPPYGDMDNPHKFIPFVILSALEGKTTELKLTLGLQKWDYIFVDDIVDAYMSLIPVYSLKNTSDKHEVFDIGTGYAPSLRTTVEILLSALNSKIKPMWGAMPYRNNEVFYACADTRSAEDKLNWKSKTTLYDGLVKTVEWFKKNKGV